MSDIQEVTLRRLADTDKFIGDLVVNLLDLPRTVQRRAIEYQALQLLAHDNGVDFKGVEPRAALEDRLKSSGVDWESKLAATVGRIGSEEMPRAVSRIGDILTSFNSDLVPGNPFAIHQTTMDDLVAVQSAARILAGIRPKFPPRYDEQKDSPQVVAIQKAVAAWVKEGKAPDTYTRYFASEVLNGIGKSLGSKATLKIEQFNRGSSARRSLVRLPSHNSRPGAYRPGIAHRAAQSGCNHS